MKKVIKIQTLDGRLHDDEKAANRYLDVLIADEVARIASELVKIGKYSATGDYILANLARFIKVDKLVRDKILPGEEEYLPTDE